jgi:acyl-CoA thioesterase
MPSRFARDTAVEAQGGGHYTGLIDTAWWIVRGPNGGYLAAIVLRAILAEAGDPARAARSLTVHYTRPPEEGPVDIDVTKEREGRTVTTLSARLTQHGKLMAIALAAVATDRSALSFHDAVMPSVPGPDDLVAAPNLGPAEVPIRAQFETRWAIGTPPSREPGRRPDDVAEVGGWIRLADPEPVDSVVVAALTDAWMPAVFSRMTEPVGVPTVDLTIHFREPPPLRPDWSLVRFTSRHAAHGYVEEDGEVWSTDGRLLAQSRQLGLFVPMAWPGGLTASGR